MKKIITISREFGAYGGTIGNEVANRLGYEYYDKAIVLKAARNANADLASVHAWDEKVPSSLTFTQSLFDFYNRPLNEKLFDAQKEVIRKMGAKGRCVIVGRNANSILKEFDHAMHVFICADDYFRISHLKERMPDVAESKIIDRMRAVDRMRRKYCAYYTDTEFGVADYYDICLNSSKIGVEKCVDIICDLAQNS